jgi:RIO kinase 1
MFDPDWAEGHDAQRQLKEKRKPKRSQREAVAELADEAIGLEGGFTTTYQPSRYESTWLPYSLSHFYDLHLITDVLAQVKGGKEATVYLCKAEPATGEELFAAKVYRPRKFRNLRNDKLYREGREVLTADGQPVKKTEHRIMRALNKKTSFGQQVAHTSWLMHEFTTLGRLHQAGVAVPQAVSAAENAILMGYIGDVHRAAHTLSETRLPIQEAQPLFDEVIQNIELMLSMGLIHGDLSAYNILYWQGKITLIDFPQVTSSRNNSSARFILYRDIQRVCEYFDRYGVRCNPRAITDSLWRRYNRTTANDVLADFSRAVEPQE